MSKVYITFFLFGVTLYVVELIHLGGDEYIHEISRDT